VIVNGSDEIGLRGSTSSNVFIVEPGGPGGSSDPPRATCAAAAISSSPSTPASAQAPLFAIPAIAHLQS
jgi:hypothetical protein